MFVLFPLVLVTARWSWVSRLLYIDVYCILLSSLSFAENLIHSDPEFGWRSQRTLSDVIVCCFPTAFTKESLAKQPGTSSSLIWIRFVCLFVPPFASKKHRSLDGNFQLKLDAEAISSIELEDSDTTAPGLMRFLDAAGRRHLTLVMLGDDVDARFQIMLGRWTSRVLLK